MFGMENSKMCRRGGNGIFKKGIMFAEFCLVEKRPPLLHASIIFFPTC